MQKIEVGTEIDLSGKLITIEAIGDGKVYYKKPDGKTVYRKIANFNQAVKHLGFYAEADKSKNKQK